MTNSGGWQIWIDRGGTFTDIVGADPRGKICTLKLLSENPSQYADAAAEGIRQMLNDNGGRSVSEIRMGTTVATNALLERKGARTGLIMSRGFGDALLIGNQDRPQLFDLHIRKPAPLFAAVLEADERLDAAGNVLEALNTERLKPALDLWRQQGIESVAICLLHAWLNPVHEQKLAELVREHGFSNVHPSHEVSPLMKLIGRAGTAVADAYLSPVLLHYVGAFQQELRGAGIECERILFMQSHGGLVSAAAFRGKDAVLSGPAGGVVGMQAAGLNAGLNQLIGFDMGGTSTDVSVCNGEPEIVNNTEISGVQLRTPMIRIHTIAAGGGSILSFDQGRFQAGPKSAGADPGPMSYGRGGPLTLTDANLLLSRIQAKYFPRVFGADGQQPLNRKTVRQAFIKLAQRISESSNRDYSAEQTAEGFLQVAIDNMANALRHISVSRGLNPADYTLCCFGGAGAQHACRVADELGIQRILLDPQASVLSAWGMGTAAVRTYRQRSINQVLSEESSRELQTLCTELSASCAAELADQGVNSQALQYRYIVNLKAVGTDTALPVALTDNADMSRQFSKAFVNRFGFAPDTASLQIDSVRTEAQSCTDNEHSKAQTNSTPTDGKAPRPVANTDIWIDNSWQKVPVYQREELEPGYKLQGPALVTETNSTTVLESGWSAEVNSALQMVLTRSSLWSDTKKISTLANPVLLEIINNRFVSVANEMGTVLRKTARSVNIKERLDFSCALFTADGDLIANAPHVPVHLGSMDDSVKSALRDHSDALARGDVILTNAPYNGGTHLPDVTAISAVVINKDTGPIEYIVASRAHHADIGGISPGSMPPFSTHIEEEGVLIDHFAVVRDGQFCEKELRNLLSDAKWPARNPDQNMADFRAQVAANERGRKLLQEMIGHYGADIVHAYAGHVQDNAEQAVRAAITKLHPGEFSYPLDNGQQICVRIDINHQERSATIDFTGTSQAADNNFNAPKAVCQAAVLYVFRTLVNQDIPLNAGCRRPLQLIIPEGCMLNPQHPAAVVGGNVETSQCITDAIYGALGVLAASQGTMNNLSFGNSTHQYYETIGGGAGAGADFHGADAVQTHMTNTRITDAEVLESRHPVLLREFSIRKNSGGRGKYCGGNGVIRELEFRQSMSAAILSNHREVAPFGLNDGEPGQTGQNRIKRHDGTEEVHGGALSTDMETGDVLIIMTPGGGGFGTP